MSTTATKKLLHNHKKGTTVMKRNDLSQIEAILKDNGYRVRIGRDGMDFVTFAVKDIVQLQVVSTLGKNGIEVKRTVTDGKGNLVAQENYNHETVEKLPALLALWN